MHLEATLKYCCRSLDELSILLKHLKVIHTALWGFNQVLQKIAL